MATKKPVSDAALAKKIWDAAPRGLPVPAQVRASLATAGLAAFEQSIATLSRRVTVLRPLEGKSAAVGAPRLGGAPDLSLGTGWPEIDGQLLSFVLQVEVEDTALALFIGRTDGGEVEHQVLAMKPGSLQRRPVPSDAAWRNEALGLLTAVPLEVQAGWEIPPVGSPEHRALIHRHPELAENSEYAAVHEALAPSREAHLFGFPPPAIALPKKLLPLFTVPPNERAGLTAASTFVVSMPTGKRFGRGVVRETGAVLSPR